MFDLVIKLRAEKEPVDLNKLYLSLIVEHPQLNEKTLKKIYTLIWEISFFREDLMKDKALWFVDRLKDGITVP
jgi:hypothetical protein